MRPHVDDVWQTAVSGPDSEVIRTENLYGNAKDLIKVIPGASYSSVSKVESDVLHQVIEPTTPRYWEDFIRLVYPTYPIIPQEKFTKLSLPQLVKDHKKDLHLFQSEA